MEINQTRFNTYAPTVKVPYLNPYTSGFGLSTNGFINYVASNTISFQIAPLVGFYNSNSRVTNSIQLNVYGFRLETIYKLKRTRTNLGFEYNRLHSLVTKSSSGKPYQWTPEKRNLLGPTINFGYKLFSNSYLFIKSTYFLNDFYTTGALDINGNVVGPVELTPYVFAIGFDFDISQIIKNSKEGKYKKK